MKKATKCFCLLALFLLAGNALYAKIPDREVFTVRNSSSSSITVNAEYWLGPAAALHPGGTEQGRWAQTIAGLELAVQCLLTARRTNVALPGEDLTVVWYSSARPSYFDELVAIPFMYKMNALFKSLEIIHNDGKGVVTLEDLGEIELLKEDGGVTQRLRHVLEIFDLEAKGP